MKIYISLLILLLISCSLHKQLQTNISNCTFDDVIPENAKTLHFESIAKKFNEDGSYVFVNNDSLLIYLDYGLNGEYWKRHYNKVAVIEKIIAYSQKTLKIKNSFLIYKKGSFNIGNEYVYNEEGQIINTIDHNQYDKYPICYKQIISNVLAKAGKKYTLHALYRDSIVSNNYKYVWNVYLDRVEEKSIDTKKNTYRVDAKTGKIIKTWITTSTPD